MSTHNMGFGREFVELEYLIWSSEVEFKVLGYEPCSVKRVFDPVMASRAA